MKRLLAAVLLSLPVTMFSFTATGHAQERAAQTFLSPLKVGLTITLKENAGRYEITVLDNVQGQLGFRVIEVGPDFITVEDIAKVRELRIPVFSIQAIVRIKIPRR